MSEQLITPNLSEAVREQTAEPVSDASIFAKMTAMRELTQRNQLRAAESSASGETSAAPDDSPVAPNEPEITSAESADIDSYDLDQPPSDTVASTDAEPVSESTESDSSSEDLIDFIEFAETNPNAKFRFMRNGKEMVIDARRAASILGQGGAIHEEARQLKIQRAEFDEYLKEQQAQQAGLTLAMEFTVAPQLQRAYDEIVRTQGYQATFQQQLAQTQDPATRARIEASLAQNERYIQQQGQLINQLKPNVDEFRRMRSQQVSQVLETNRKSFSDKELRNEYVYNELRDKLARTWAASSGELVPGVRNLDLISSDETLLGLIRDGLKYRDRPAARQAGNSIAQLTRRSGSSTAAQTRSQDESIARLREQAKAGDKKAGDNLLTLQLSKIRAARGGR
jgi:hypothetical protein